jgi:hypothetical protein
VLAGTHDLSAALLHGTSDDARKRQTGLRPSLHRTNAQRRRYDATTRGVHPKGPERVLWRSGKPCRCTAQHRLLDCWSMAAHVRARGADVSRVMCTTTASHHVPHLIPSLARRGRYVDRGIRKCCCFRAHSSHLAATWACSGLLWSALVCSAPRTPHHRQHDTYGCAA